MNIKEARLLFQAGALKEPVIRKTQGGWIAVLEGKHPLNPALETARGPIRVFKTADAAIETLFEVGFHHIGIAR